MGGRQGAETGGEGGAGVARTHESREVQVEPLDEEREKPDDPRAEVEVALPHPRVLIKVGVGRLRAVSGKAKDEFRELRIITRHVMSWYIADGLPALSGGVQGSCWPPRAHECTQGAPGNAGAKAWQGSRDRVALGDVG